MAGVVSTVVRQCLADFVRDLVPALRDTFAEQLQSQRKVLATVNELCDEQAARLEYFIKLSKKARDLLDTLTDDVADERGADAAEDEVPTMENLLGGLMAEMSADKKGATKLEKLMATLKSDD